MDYPKKIRELLASGNTDKAISELQKYSETQDIDFQNRCIILSGQFKKLEKRSSMFGENDIIEEKHIIANILDLISSIDKTANDIKQTTFSFEKNKLLKQEYNLLKEEFTKLQTQFETLEQKNKIFAKEKDSLKRENKLTNEKRAKFQQQCETLQKDNTSICQENDKLKQKCNFFIATSSVLFIFAAIAWLFPLKDSTDLEVTFEYPNNNVTFIDSTNLFDNNSTYEIPVKGRIANIKSSGLDKIYGGYFHDGGWYGDSLLLMPLEIDGNGNWETVFRHGSRQFRTEKEELFKFGLFRSRIPNGNGNGVNEAVLKESMNLPISSTSFAVIVK